MWHRMHSVLKAIGLSGVVVMGGGCDAGVGDAIADTVFFALRIVDVWV